MKLHYPEGMKLHGENACKYHGFEKYDWKTDREKPAVFWLYTEDDYKYLSAHQGKKIVIWNGSDVLLLANNFAGRYINVVRDTSITHVCLNRLLQAELAQMGIYSIVRYLFYGDPTRYSVQSPLTKDAYLSSNAGRGAEYGEHLLNAIAWQFKDWNFHIFGIDPTVSAYCDNVKYYGWVSEDEMDKITNNFQVCFRLNMHDGFPQTICKALLRGHTVISRLPYDGLTHVAQNYQDLIAKFEVVSGNGVLFDQPNVKDLINNFDFLTI